MISVYIKKIEESAVIPTRATDLDAGDDLYAIKDGVVAAGGRKVVGTGIAIAIPQGKNVFAPSYYGRTVSYTHLPLPPTPYV